MKIITNLFFTSARDFLVSSVAFILFKRVKGLEREDKHMDTLEERVAPTAIFILENYTNLYCTKL